MVGPRVLADHQDQLGGVHVVERDGALADADDAAERHAARLVAHVGAVGQVVRAEHARHQLVHERGLVAGAPRRVEHGAIGRRERSERGSDARQGVVPADRLVVGGAGRPVHRLGQASLLAEPIVALTGECVDRVSSEERRRDAPLCRLLRHGLGAVLAELDAGGVVRFRPRAPGAVEAVGLVHVQERARPLAPAHLGAHVAGCCDDAGQAGRPRLGRGRRELLVVVGRGGRRLHAPHHPGMGPNVSPAERRPAGAAPGWDRDLKRCPVAMQSAMRFRRGVWAHRHQQGA